MNDSFAVRLAHAAPLAVITASYGGRLGRMTLWNTQDDTLSQSVWIKGKISALDVSSDGEYAAYFVTAHHRRVPSYMAISRPPFLTALAFWPILHISSSEAYFSPDGGFKWEGSSLEPRTWLKVDPELLRLRIEPGCPFEIQTVDGFGDFEGETFERDQTRIGMNLAMTQYGEIARDVQLDALLVPQMFPEAQRIIEECLWFDNLAEIFSQLPGKQDSYQPPVWRCTAKATWDHGGRLIVTAGYRIFAFCHKFPGGNLLFDFTEGKFEEVVPPSWARTWSDPRQPI